MIRKAIATSLVTVAASTVAITAAHADFHQRCDEAPRNVSVALAVEGEELVFSGHIVCIGADSASITLLRLTPLVPAGEPTDAPLDENASCTSCGAEGVHAEGRAPADVGVYQVHMETVITGNDGTQRPSRTVSYAYLGAGDPVRIG